LHIKRLINNKVKEYLKILVVVDFVSVAVAVVFVVEP